MRVFLFKLLFRLTWWIAPDKPRVNKIFELYLEYVKAEEDYIECQERQAQLDACVRPRTETYEWLTCRKQREQYLKGKRIRGKFYSTKMYHTDFLEAKQYHDS